MFSRDYRDIVGGGLLVAVGGAFAWYAATQYSMGTILRMGPGMFPAILGILLAGFGLAQMIPAFFRKGALPDLRVWSPLFVLSGVAAFALTIQPLGLVPAVVVTVALASFAELKFRPVGLVALCASLCLMAWLIFRVGLGLNLPLFRWPF